MTTLSRSRCFHHGLREAAALCPSCARTFCRECVLEHKGRISCRECLGEAQGPARGLRGGVWRLAGCAAGVAMAWLAFRFLGQALARLTESASS